MPSRLSASLTSLGAKLRMRLGIFNELRRAVTRHVVGLRGEYGNILRTVVGLVMIQMMDALVRQKVSPQLGLGHKAMLINVPISVGGRMVRRIDVNIPGFVGIASALPSGAIRAFVPLSPMTTAVSVMLPNTNATFGMTGRGNGRDLAATTHAQSRGVWGLLDCPTSMIHVLGRFGP